jgi:AraC-like DNA-binding protein
MIYAFETNIVALIDNLVKALNPYAQVNKISLCFKTNQTVINAVHEPYSLLQSVSHLVLQLISLIPYQSSIEVRLQSLPQPAMLVIEIENNGINLMPVCDMIVQGPNPFCAHALPNGTLYRLTMPLNNQKTEETEHLNSTINDNKMPQFYAEMRKRLRSHFTQSEKLVAALSQHRPIEASFLQKINTLIKANLHDEDFDTQVICRAMGMSRTQLFRRLKPLIRQAPATYIKTMRLQKAKELLETTELTVSEVAFKCGFIAPSHFTKVFQQQYGLLPSLFQRSRHATNE